MFNFNLANFTSVLMLLFFVSCIENKRPQVTSETSIETDEYLPADSNELVTLKTSLNTTYYIPGNASNSIYLYLEASTKPFSFDGVERKPLNLTIVIDRSGSMEGKKLEYAKKAAIFILENLNSKDFLSIVSYDDEVITEWASGRVEDKTAIRSKIEHLTPDGSTNLGGGLLQGYNQVKTNYNQEITNRVLILSDGLANQGITSEVELNKIARNMNIESGISLSTFGIGIDYNEDLLLSMAENGGGNYYFISSPEEIPNIFKEELDGLLKIVAQNTILEVALPKGITVEQVFGFKSEVNNSLLSIHFRDLTADDVKGVLVKFKISDQVKTDLSFESTLKYTMAIEDYSNKQLGVNVLIQPTYDNEIIAANRSEKVEQWVTFYEANYNLEKAMALVDSGNYEEAKKILNYNNGYVESREFKWGSNALSKKVLEQNKAYDSVVVNFEELQESEKTYYQKEYKSKSYKNKVRK